jgi:hypothetical protein
VHFVPVRGRPGGVCWDGDLDGGEAVVCGGVGGVLGWERFCENRRVEKGERCCCVCIDR